MPTPSSRQSARPRLVPTPSEQGGEGLVAGLSGGAVDSEPSGDALCGVMDAAALMLEQVGALVRALGAAGTAGGTAPAQSLLTEAQAAQFLGVSRRSVARMVQEGHLQALRIRGGRGRRFRTEDLLACLEVEAPGRQAPVLAEVPMARSGRIPAQRRPVVGSFETKLKEARRGRS